MYVGPCLYSRLDWSRYPNTINTRKQNLSLVLSLVIAVVKVRLIPYSGCREFAAVAFDAPIFHLRASMRILGTTTVMRSLLVHNQRIREFARKKFACAGWRSVVHDGWNSPSPPNQTREGRAGSPHRRNFPAFTAVEANIKLIMMPDPGGGPCAGWLDRDGDATWRWASSAAIRAATFTTST